MYISIIESDKKMETNNQDLAFFISFCVEHYKKQKGIPGEKAMEELYGYGVLDYLRKNYDALHTQSIQWVMEDINEFIKSRLSIK